MNHSGTVYAIAFSGAKVFVGGAFDSIDGVAAHNVAVWDGHAWSGLFTGTDKAVRALLVSGTSLFAGGDFQAAGGLTGLTVSLAQWTLSADPSTDGWQAVGDAPGGFAMPGSVYALATTSLTYNSQAWPVADCRGALRAQRDEFQRTVPSERLGHQQPGAVEPDL